MWGQLANLANFSGTGKRRFFTGSGREHPDPAVMRNALFGGCDALTLARRIAGLLDDAMGGGFVSQCSDASDVRGFHTLLNAGRVVRKGQKGIKIVAPVMDGDEGTRVANTKPAFVLDVWQTDELTQRSTA